MNSAVLAKFRGRGIGRIAVGSEGVVLYSVFINPAVQTAASCAKTRKSTHFRKCQRSEGKIDQDDLFCR